MLYERPGYGNPQERLYMSVVNDDKDEILRLLKDPEVQQLLMHYSFKAFSDASVCVIVVLDGEAKGFIDMEDV